MLFKKVAYWAMSSRIPRKFPFLGDPTNSLSPLNAKSRSAINLITMTTHYKTDLQYCSSTAFPHSESMVVGHGR